MLYINEVYKSFGEVKAVNGVSLEINPGEIYGLLGANGAGKTTMFRMILNIIKPDSGVIQYNNQTMSIENSYLFGYLPEERSLYQREKVADQLVYFAKLKGLTSKEANLKLDYWLEKFEVTEYKHRKVKELSKGNQQKIAFIAALIHDPEIIILDEPFTGLDPMNTKIFKTLIQEIASNGKTIIFSSHQMDVIEELCDRLAIMKKGKIILEGKLHDIKEKYKKKNVFIQGEDINHDDFAHIKGVVNITNQRNDLVVSIEDKSVIESLLQVIKNKKVITKFVQEEPSLDEIFISKMGEKYEG
ncbi:MAG TPA: ATP-binding cassette domain-containing protein [Bacilli bacterium]|nr:ATP-binding cassette domain-containing protein [Bacilli bacterium]